MGCCGREVGPARKMDDDLHVFQGWYPIGIGSNIADLAKFDARLTAGPIIRGFALTAVGPAADSRAHRMAGSGKCGTNGGADEAIGAGNQDAAHESNLR